MWRPKIILAIALSGVLSDTALAQFGYGIRGAGGLRGNSIAGSGGLRGDGIFGTGGLPTGIPGGASIGTFGVSRPYGSFRNQGGGGGAIKPFANYSSQPTVSPYLNLFRNDLSGQSDLNYQTLVRPQLQQQQFNSAIQKQDLQNARRLQSIAAQSDFNPQGARDQFPTGHQTVYNYTSHYFPQTQRRQKPGR